MAEKPSASPPDPDGRANDAGTRAPAPWPSPITRADLEAMRLAPEHWARLAFDALPAPPGAG
ncbi:MAG: hypothetical protein INF84_14175 [Roseomonas sp.]|nr:hypothetical protein [Roseomonas sp.]